MPRFEGATDFPSKSDDLPKTELKDLFGLLFTSIDPSFSFEEMVKPIMDKVSFLPLDTLEFDQSRSKIYQADCNWALYCDNYLEGFHVPFVHPSLQNSLDFGSYEYKTFEYCNLQTGIAKEGEPCFDLPSEHEDFGKRVYGYYFWLYPNLMLNFYPWGLSLNYVRAKSIDQTEIQFRTYRFAGTEHKFEDTNLEVTELEDEQVVQSVQKGIQSRLYTSGRYSPSMEICVHHFHRLLAKDLG